MSDTLMEMGLPPIARHVLRRFGIKPPPQLIRSYRDWSDEILQRKHILLSPTSLFQEVLAPYLKSQEATVSFHSRGQLAVSGTDLSEKQVFQGTVFDASAFDSLKDLKGLYSFFHGLKGQLGFNHRLIVLNKVRIGPEGKAITEAVESFTRSLAREFGPKGINVNALRFESMNDLESALPVIAFFLSDFCAFITGQVIPLHSSASSAPHLQLAGSLAGKRALVTGAAQGIGLSIANRLAEEGAHVIALDRQQNEAALLELTKEIDGDALFATIEGDNSAWIEKLSAITPTLDIIVHNAGITRDRTLFGMREKDWDDVLTVNLEAVIDITGQILRRGMLNKGGRIVCMSSLVGLSGNFGQTNYSASKAGLIGYVRGMAEHLHREEGTINAVAPGFIETDMTSKIPFVAKQFARRLSSLAQGGQPDDVADLVTFLSSPCSSVINGQVIRVCGGSFLGA
ncbi:MAG: 3-oxoacyl-ACP reductase [Bdellovibrionota bacterium]